MGELAARVIACGMSECLFNHGSSCHAMAIAIQNRYPVCNTCLRASSKNGVTGTDCCVRACREYDCQFNRDLSCMADGVKIGPHKNQAYCLTFSARAL